MLKDLSKLDPILTDEFIEDLKGLIDLYGYRSLDTDDDLALYFLISTEVEKLKNQINDSTIPKGLERHLQNRILANFYELLIASGKIGDDFDYGGAVKQIVEGDSSITFTDSQSNLDQFKLLLKNLKSERDYICYRKLKW